MLRKEIPCYILAGGKSRRFGEDKLLYKINGKSVIERVLETAKKVFKEVYIVAKEREKFSFLKVPVIEDERKEQASIIGLYTALKHSKREECFILSGDLPLISERTLNFLLKRYNPPITLAKTDNVHPLVGIYSKIVLKLLEEFIEKKNFKIYEFIKNFNYKAVELPPELEKTVTNLNRKEELEKVIIYLR
ncbi:molybdenum cofactor guanylyltransferase MobA [Aquifex pyrophilus]